MPRRRAAGGISALADLLDEPFAASEARRLETLRLDALEERVQLQMALGLHAELVGELEALVIENPFREGLRAQLMVCLYRCQRQTDALRVFKEGREALEEQLGLEPGQRLSELEIAILNHDPNLELTEIDQRLAPVDPRERHRRPRWALPAPIPRAMSTLVGRVADIEDIISVVGSSPVTTLVGVGGCGKTRLAWAAAERFGPSLRRRRVRYRPHRGHRFEGSRSTNQ